MINNFASLQGQSLGLSVPHSLQKCAEDFFSTQFLAVLLPGELNYYFTNGESANAKQSKSKPLVLIHIKRFYLHM